MIKMRTYREYLIEKFADREKAMGYLQAALEDYQTFGDTGVFLVALKTVIEAQGGVSKFAKRANTTTEALSKALSDNDTPPFNTLVTVIKALGYRLSIEPLEDEAALDTTQPPVLFTIRQLADENPNSELGPNESEDEPPNSELTPNDLEKHHEAPQ